MRAPCSLPAFTLTQPIDQCCCQILRRSLREIYAKAETHALTIPATIENPAVLHDIFHVVKKVGSN